MVRHRFHRRRDRGAAAVEFALVMPLLVMILLGIMEFGYAFFIQSTVAGAARVGVRDYAINWKVANSSATAIQKAESAVPLPAGDVVSATFTSPCAGPTTQTTLVLTYKYHSLTGLFDPLFGGNKVTITGKGSMACGG